MVVMSIKNPFVSIFASTLYVYSPYHALDIYVRGAAGELWAMAFLPLFLLGLYKIAILSSIPITGKTVYGFFLSEVRQRSFPWIILLALSFAGIILSHNISGMITGLVFGLVIVSRIFLELSKKRKFTLTTCYSLGLLLGLGLSSFFWLPAVSEMHYTSVQNIISGGSYYADHFVYIDQIWASPWGFAGSAPGRLDGMSFMLGKIQIILSLLSICLAFFLLITQKKFSKSYLVILSATLFSLFMATEYSLFIWHIVSPLAFIQFPWRFLLFASFGFAILPMFTLIAFSHSRNYFALLLIPFIIGYNSRYFNPQKFLEVNSQDLTSAYALNWEASTTSNEYMPLDFIRPRNYQETLDKRAIIGEDVGVKYFNNSGIEYNFELVNNHDQQVTFPIASFPGWEATINGKNIPLGNSDGKIVIPLTKGVNQGKVVLHDTFPRALGNVISLLSFGIIGLFIYGRRTVKH